MDKTIIFRTKKHIYLYNRELKLFYVLHPLIPFFHRYHTTACHYDELIKIDPFFADYTAEECDYYFRKYQYLSKTGILSDKNDTENLCQARLQPIQIKKGMANLFHVVFEVTDKCNLRCKYCGLSGLYEGFGDRTGKDLSFEKAQCLLDQLIGLWSSDQHYAAERNIAISFYGGEPLMNFPLIEKIIDYLDQHPIPHITYKYGMTTNCMLLDKHMDYLVCKDFNLLLSLDGDKNNNAYRVTQGGQESYDKVISNIKLLKKKYPEYYEKKVSFNAVLHSKNSVEKILTFFNTELDKVPRISGLKTDYIRKDKWQEFLATYRNMNESVYDSENYQDVEEKIFINLPDIHEFGIFLHSFLCYTYYRHSSFYTDFASKPYIPTGTCMPFSRKMFLTVDGEFLPCENVPHHFPFLGKIGKTTEIDIEKTARHINALFDKLAPYCNQCYNAPFCKQCLYLIPDILHKPACRGFLNKEGFARQLSNMLSNAEEHPDRYSKILDTITYY